MEEKWMYSLSGAAAGAAALAVVGFGVSWLRRDYVVNGGWATFGQERSFQLADACVEALNKL